jgi:hypothetical protein
MTGGWRLIQEQSAFLQLWSLLVESGLDYCVGEIGEFMKERLSRKDTAIAEKERR